jgi:hypothetical protein
VRPEAVHLLMERDARRPERLALGRRRRTVLLGYRRVGDDKGRSGLDDVDRHVKVLAESLDLQKRGEHRRPARRTNDSRQGSSHSQRGRSAESRTSGSPPHSDELRTLAMYWTNSSSVIMPSFVAPAASSPTGLAR